MNYRCLMESYNFGDPLSIVTLVTEHVPFTNLGNSTYVIRRSLAPGAHEISRTGLTQTLYVSLFPLHLSCHLGMDRCRKENSSWMDLGMLHSLLSNPTGEIYLNLPS